MRSGVHDPVGEDAIAKQRVLRDRKPMARREAERSTSRSTRRGAAIEARVAEPSAAALAELDRARKPLAVAKHDDRHLVARLVRVQRIRILI